MSSQLISLLLFGIAASFSPGPNNIMTSYTAFNFGIKKTVPTMLGVIIGWTLLVIFLQIGSVIIFQKFEIIQKILRLLGSIYLLYMAYKLSFSSNKYEKVDPQPITFLNTFFFSICKSKSHNNCSHSNLDVYQSPNQLSSRLNHPHYHFFSYGRWKSSSMVFNGKIFEKICHK